MQEIGCLTPLERWTLIRCYSDGHSEAEVAGWRGVSQQAVDGVLRRAAAKLVAAGFPRPRPYGRGSRAELRRMLPGVFSDEAVPAGRRACD